METCVASAEALRPVARRLRENAGVAFVTGMKAGAFASSFQLVRTMTASPNPDGRANADVIIRWMNGLHVSHR